MAANAISPGNHAIVVGGSSGIGKAVAKKLLLSGMFVTIIARREAVLLEAWSELIKAANSSDRLAWKAADVRDFGALSLAIDEAVETFGNARLLVVSSGIVEPGFLVDQSVDIFKDTIDINYLGVVHAIKCCLKTMQAAGGGHIAIVSSAAGLMGIVGYAAYSSSKFALQGLAEALRFELQKMGVNMSIVYPPDTETPQLEYENELKPEATKRVTEAVKAWKASEVADLIVNGINRKKFSITPGWQIYLLSKFYPVLYPILYAVISRKIRGVI